MGLFDRFKKKKEETINTDGVMISTTYRFIEDEYIRITIGEMGTDGITGLDKDQLTEKLLYFYDNNLPVTERINILMNTFDIEEETAKQIEYVSFAKTSLIADYLRNKERGATKFNIKGANRILKKNININEFLKYTGFMIENDAIPVFNIKQLPKKRFSRNKVKSVPKKETIPAPETKEPEETEPTKEIGITSGGLKVPDKIDKNSSELSELEILMNREIELNNRLQTEEGYWGSDISRDDFRKFNNDVYDYLENNPEDYITSGARYCKVWLEYQTRASEEELKMFELLGKGLYYENKLEQYDEAIELYKEVDLINRLAFRNEIAELVRDYGERDYLYSAKAKERIDICNNKKERIKIKKLEAEAKELEETNPTEAIKKYEELNIINPNLQKYDKAIIKIKESEAKELEGTNPEEAIKRYEELKRLNPSVKKYDKAIFRIMESEAIKITKSNPAEAIKIYEELNILNPNLKKYDKAIIRIKESEAKELEVTNPAEAIKLYQELNILNPNLKKYDKRIEILERKLDK